MEILQIPICEVTPRPPDSRQRARTSLESKVRQNEFRPKSTHFRRPHHWTHKEHVQVLSHQSMLTFASVINQETAETLAIKLNVPPEVIDDIKTRVMCNVRSVKEPTVLQNYHMIWYWRGKSVSNEMAEYLVNTLRTMNRWELANALSRAHREHRKARISDFY